MINVKFILMEPGNHHEIAQGTFNVVPRVGDYVTLSDITRLVHSVVWDIGLGGMTVDVNLK